MPVTSGVAPGPGSHGPASTGRGTRVPGSHGPLTRGRSPGHGAPPEATGIGLQEQTLSFDGEAAEHYGQIRAHLACAGLLIGPNDLLIAATALAKGLTLVTNNTKE